MLPRGPGTDTDTGSESARPLRSGDQPAPASRDASVDLPELFSAPA